MTSETSPLIPKPDGPPAELTQGRFSPYRRVLLASLFLSISFVFTATPLLFSYRTFTCDEYYQTHPPYQGHGDRCALHEIETNTARDISIMIAATTVAGVLNLFVTTWEIRHWGVRSALNQQTFWPCLRNLCQTYAMYKGGRAGILIVQVTQSITILGGGAGYMLAANNYIAELVPAEERTGAFGVLQGVAMFGTSVGFTLGGLAGDKLGTPAPFQITFCLLVLSTLFTRFFLPYIPPAASLPPPPSENGSTEITPKPPAKESAFSFLHCLLVFKPEPHADGQRGKFWGLTLLGLGCFSAVLATSYVPLMLQLTATNSYGYRPTENGYLMSLSSLSRALFLAFAFPRIIAFGRKRASKPKKSSTSGTSSAATSRPRSPVKDAIPTDARDFESHAILGAEEGMEEPANVEAAMPPTDAKHGSAFDLTFLRWSMVVDAVLTALVGFSSQGWHMMLAAGILPLASGTAPAAKGCMMEMVSPEKKGDALSAIALVETFAMISTVSLFGAVFAYLSEIGRPNDVFFLNAGMALLAAVVLLFVRFPRKVATSSSGSV